MIKLLVALALSMPLWQAPADETVDLIWKPKVDQKIEYSMTMESSTSAHSFKATGQMNLKVLKVNPDGGYEVETTYANGKVVNDGTDVEVPDAKPSVQKYDARGNEIKDKKDPKAKKEDDDDDDDDSTSIISALGFGSPVKPVKPAETWTTTIEADDDKDQPEIKVTFTYVGTEKYLGVDAWKVTAKAKVKGETPQTGEAVYYLSTEDGSLVRGEIDIDSTSDETPHTKVRLTRKDLIK